MYDSFTTLAIEQADGVLTCRFNRPDRRNAVDDVMHRELVRFFRTVADDESLRVVVLTGNGRAFCAGGDVRHMDDVADAHDEGHSGLFRDAANLFRAMLSVRAPIIAAVNGDAIGLGASIAVLSDIVIMSEASRIGDPHLRVGLVPGDGALIAWPMLLSLNVAKELLFTGRLLDPAEAARLGLANRVVAAESLLDEAGALAADLARVPPHALHFTKRILNKVLEERANYALDLGLAFEAVTLRTTDHKNAVAAFAARSAKPAEATEAPSSD